MAAAKMGRPTDDPKSEAIHIRLAEDDMRRLSFCSAQTGLTRAAVIRQGIKLYYERVKKSLEQDE